MKNVTKRKSPADNPAVALEWKELHRYNIEELGLSNRQSYYRISEKYGYSWGTIQYWVNENVRRLSIKQKKDTYVPYSTSGSKRIKYKRTHGQLYMDIRRHPDIYFEELYSNDNRPLSIDELTDRLHSLTGIRMRTKTLKSVVHQYEKKTGVKFLEEVKEQNQILYHMF